MTSKIDKPAVEMQFDNREFERNVQTTIKSLDNLKKGLALDGAAKSLGNLEATSKRFSLDGIASGVDTIAGRFTNLGIIGVTVLSNIATQALMAGEQLVKSLTIAPVKMGLDEYETKLNAIQTILANTKSEGTNLDTVTKALDDLNAYADYTIYDFQQMTRNIGTFTAAGVKLDPAVAAIKGIGNLAAISGSSADQASTVMYQLSQALSSGTVKLMDWNSVVNAGMGGKVFQEALMRTAKVHGVAVDEIIEANGSFRDSLQTGWLTADILTETLNTFTGDMTAAQLATAGYNEQQIADIQDMGKTALDAATKVKTFSQLINTLKEAAQSGWAKTFEIVIGDFEEAKELWTNINNIVGGLIGKQAEARNDLLQGWKDLGGRKELIEALGNAFKFLGDILKPITEAFREVFPPKTSQNLYDLTHNFLLFTQKLEVSAETASKIKTVFEGLFGAIKMGVDVVGSLIGGVVKAVGALVSGENFLTPIVAMFKDMFLTITGGSTAIGEAVGSVSSTIGNLFGNVVSSISKALSTIGDAFVYLGKIIATFFGVLFGVGEDYGWQWFMGKNGVADEFLAKVGEIAFVLRENVYKAFQVLSDSVRNAGKTISEWARNIGIDTSALKAVVSPIIQTFRLLGEALGLVADGVDKIARPFVGLLESIIDCLTRLFDALGRSFEENGTQTVFDLLGGALMIAIMENLRRFLKMLGDLVSMAPEMAKSIIGILDGVKGCLSAYQKDIKSKTILRIAEAVALLAAAIFVLSTVDPAKLGMATGAITALFGELSGAIFLLNKMNFSDLMGTKMMAMGVQMVLLALAITLLAKALKEIASLSWSELAKGMTGLTVTIGLLVGATRLLKVNAGATWEGALLIFAFAASIKVMADAIGKLAKVVSEVGSIDVKTLIKGLIVVAVILGELYTFIKFAKFDKMGIKESASLFILATALNMLALAVSGLGKMSVGDLIKGVSALAVIFVEITAFTKAAAASKSGPAYLMAMGGAILMIAVALKVLGTMDLADLATSLVALGLLLLILVKAMNSFEKMPAGAGALILVAAAITALAVAMKIMGSMSISTLVKGLAGVAATIAVFVVAAKLLQPVAPVLISVGTGLLMFGAAVFLAGAGVSLLVAGLTALTALGATGLIAFKGMIEAFASTIPTLMKAVGTGLIAICDTIIQGAPKIIEAVTVIVSGLLDALTKLIPKTVPLITEFIQAILDVIGNPDTIKKIVDAGMSVLIGLLKGISDHLDEVVEVVEDIIITFLDSFAESIVDITDALFKDLVLVIDGIAYAIENNTGSFWNAIKHLITSIVELFKSGWNTFVEIGTMIKNAIWEGVKGLGQMIWDALDISEYLPWGNGPSSEDVNKAVQEGVEAYKRRQGSALGPTSSSSNVVAENMAATGMDVVNAIKTMELDGSRAMGQALKSITDSWDDTVDFRPVITPVVDMTNVQNGIDSALSRVGTIDVAVSKVKAESAYKTEVSAAVDRPSILNNTTNSPTINIENHYTVRGEADVLRISRDLKDVVDRYAAARGVMAT